MKSALSYAKSSDQELYAQTTIYVGKQTIKLSAATLASSPEKPNEDAFAIAYENDVLLAAVFDGVSSQKPIKSLGAKSGARFASHFLKDTFSQIQSSASPKDFVLELNKKLLQTINEFEDTSLADTHTLPGSTGTIIKIDTSKNTVSFANVSDSFGIVYYHDGNSQLFTIDKNSKFDDRIFALIKHIAERKHIYPRVARQDPKVKEAILAIFTEKNNNPNGKGCGVINGDPQVEQYIQTGTLSLQRIKAILIGSDGLIPIGWSEKKMQDRQRLLTEIENGGFQKLFKTKKQSEDADPDWNYVRYKHSDDATGILIEIKTSLQ